MSLRRWCFPVLLTASLCLAAGCSQDPADSTDTAPTAGNPGGSSPYPPRTPSSTQQDGAVAASYPPQSNAGNPSYPPTGQEGASGTPAYPPAAAGTAAAPTADTAVEGATGGSGTQPYPSDPAAAAQANGAANSHYPPSPTGTYPPQQGGSPYPPQSSGGYPPASANPYPPSTATAQTAPAGSPYPPAPNGAVPTYGSGYPPTYGSAAYGSAAPGGTGNPTYGPGQPAGSAAGGYADGAAAGAAPAAPKSWEELAIAEFREGRNADAFRYLLARAVALDAGRKELGEQFGWVPGLRRPVLAVRWAIGMDYSADDYQGKPYPIGGEEQSIGSASGGGSGGYRGGGASYGGSGSGTPGYGGQAAGSDENWDPGVNDRERLLAYTGELGEKMLAHLEQHLRNGDFGKVLTGPVEAVAPDADAAQDGFGVTGYGPVPGPVPYGYGTVPGSSDPLAGEGQEADAPEEPRGLLPGVVLLGIGNRNELLDEAAEQGADVLVYYSVQVSYTVRNQVVQNNTRIQLLDVQKKAPLFTMRQALNNMKVQYHRQHSAPDDPVDEGLEDLFAAIDKQCVLQPLPAQLKPVHAAKRLEYLAAGDHDDPLAVVAEMMLYRQRNLVDDQQLQGALATLVGADTAQTLVKGTEQQRKQTVRQWLPEGAPEQVADRPADAAANPSTSLGAAASPVLPAAAGPAAVAGGPAAAGPASQPSPEDLEFFRTHIQPVLARNCFQCHSSQAKQLKGGLLVDSRDGLMRGGDSGPVIVPGNADASLLIRALRHEDLEMPPRRQLPPAVIADFEQWVMRGAPYPAAL